MTSFLGWITLDSHFFLARVHMYFEGQLRAPGVKKKGQARCLGRWFRVLLARCPNADYFIWFESFESHIAEVSVHQLIIYCVCASVVYATRHQGA